MISYMLQWRILQPSLQILRCAGSNSRAPFQFCGILRGTATSSDLTILQGNSSIKRGNYSRITTPDVTHFEKILESGRVVKDPSELAKYNTDWMKSYSGCSQLLLLPRTTEEVSAILSYCNQKCLAVCPQGGNTGLVGGSVPVFDEIILSTVLMNQVISLDATSARF